MAEPRRVNRLLGAKPSLGPIPGDLIVPWGIILVLGFLISHSFLGLEWWWTIAIIVWGCGAWWALTGSKSYRFLSKFVPVPRRWARGYARYASIETVIPKGRRKK